MPYASHNAAYRTGTARYGNRFYALVLGSLTGLFALRVAGQAIQRWAPRPFLPPFDAFQGSALPYWLLLSSQLAILAVMLGVTSRVYWGALRKSTRSGRTLLWFGGIYLAVSLARLAVGLAASQPGTWLSAWIPALFHAVLAGFALALAAYHAEQPGRLYREVTP